MSATLYLRVGVVGGGAVVGAALLPILAKWLLVGRWSAVDFPVWGPAYLRFWTVKTLLRTSPLMLAVGTPLYSLYLRALGADIGPGALILSRHVPVCTDLLTVGPGAVIRRDAFFTCYHAEAGRIRTGRVTIGARAHVGEATVLGLGTVLGDDARLGHASSLSDGESVPAGQRATATGPGRTARRAAHRTRSPAPPTAGLAPRPLHGGPAGDRVPGPRPAVARRVQRGSPRSCVSTPTC